MKQAPIFLFIINLFLGLSSPLAFSQTEKAKDSVVYKEKYGLRLGIDLSKPLRTFLEDDYKGFEIVGDYRVYKDFYAAAEVGNENLHFKGDNISTTSRGSYIKIGADYNAYKNWEDMQNSIFAGLRYGFSTFAQELNEYRIYSTNQYFEPDIRQIDSETKGLTANWIELMVGIKVELVNNLFLSANVQLKRMLFQASPSNLDNLSVPGFNRTYDGSAFGVGYGYSLSYLIPLYKKARD